jgi:PAS domain S-box-containing protein
MSWVTIIWSMVASACLTLAAIRLLVWWRQRTAWANLFFALTAVAAAAMAFGELRMMRAETPGQLAALLRWRHVEVWGLIVALVCFVRFYLQAGRPWLAWTIASVRTVALLLNFLTGQNLNYREVTRLRSIPFLGESVTAFEGVPNPWMLVGQLSLMLLVAFVVDAAVTVWRRGERRKALVTSASIVFFAVAGTIQSVLVGWGLIHCPVTVSLFSAGLLAAMAYEMSLETLRAAELSGDLRESEERMALAAEVAGFGVWVWSIASTQVWGSARWRHLFGFAPDAVVTFEEVIQRVDPSDREMVEREVRRALADRDDYAGEFRVILPDGTQRRITSRGRAYPDANGMPARMIGAAIDITERKRAEEALRTSERAARQAVEQLRLVHRVGTHLSSGLDLEHVMQALYQECQKIGDTDTFYLALCDDAAGTVSFPINYKDGERRVLPTRNLRETPGVAGHVVQRRQTVYIPDLGAQSAGVIPVLQSGRATRSYVGIPLFVHDRIVGVLSMQSCAPNAYTPEQIQTLEALATQVAVAIHNSRLHDQVERERNLANALIDSIPGLFCLVNRHGYLLRWNATAEKMLGITAAEGGSLHMRECVAAEDQARFADVSTQALAGAPAEMETLLMARRGGWGVPVHLVVTRVQFGGETYLLVVGVDVSERKHSEAERRRAQAELAHATRAASLGEMAGALAHELNQPLAAVLTNAQTALSMLNAESPDIEEVRGALADIVADDIRAAETIRKLRALVRKGEPSREPLDVNQIIKDVVSLARSDTLIRGINVRVEPAEKLPSILGDRIQLQQVVLNLLLNAEEAIQQASPAGGEVVVRTELDRAGQVVVSVQDTGAGIKEAEAGRLFEPFYTTKPQGLGMGLSICRSIIEAHGGAIWMTPNADRGATFSFRLPANQGAAK